VFLPRDAMHSVDYAVARCLSVRLSVCLSVTRRHSVKTVQNIIKLFSPSGSHTILVFAVLNIMAILQRCIAPPLNGGVECRGMTMKKSRCSTNISLYLRNGTRYRHSFSRILIELIHALLNGVILNDHK